MVLKAAALFLVRHIIGHYHPMIVDIDLLFSFWVVVNSSHAEIECIV